MTRADLAALMRSARMHNLNGDVTGMLLHHGDLFLQYLEGPEQAVEASVARLEADPRHTELTHLFQGPTSARLFGGHALAFQEVSAAGARGSGAVAALLLTALGPSAAPDADDATLRRLWAEVASNLPR